MERFSLRAADAAFGGRSPQLHPRLPVPALEVDLLPSGRVVIPDRHGIALSVELQTAGIGGHRRADILADSAAGGGAVELFPVASVPSPEIDLEVAGRVVVPE